VVWIWAWRLRRGPVSLWVLWPARRWAHQRDLNRADGGDGTLFLVVVEFVALDAIDAAAVFAIELDFHVVEAGIALLELHLLRRVNLVLRMRAEA